jgi:hypothetical protein
VGDNDKNAFIPLSLVSWVRWFPCGAWEPEKITRTKKTAKEFSGVVRYAW